MIDLDDLTNFTIIDKENMLSEINDLPSQLQKAWKMGLEKPLPEWSGIKQIVLAGMGGSAIGADLLAAYAEPLCRIPIFVHRNYDLPAWANGQETLVVASSHSGNTEETLSAFNKALENNCRVLAISTGGELSQKARTAGKPIWVFEHKGQPRAAVGFSFGMLLALLTRLKLIPDPSKDLTDAVNEMREQQKTLLPEIPVTQNLAKRAAGQWVGRWVTVIGADFLAPVARRWKGQINEVAKTWAQFDVLPEADHNTLAGVINAANAVLHTMVIFLHASSYHPRNSIRTSLTKNIFMLEALNTDIFHARGDSRLAQMWTTLHFGDYAAYYLAIAYKIDPTPITSIEGFKEELKAAKQ